MIKEALKYITGLKEESMDPKVITINGETYCDKSLVRYHSFPMACELRVTFNRVAAGSLKDYSGTVDWAEIETTPVEMTFDKKKYFAFALDDVDKVQLKADVMTATTQEHSAVLAEQYDKDFFVALTTGVKLKIGAAGSKKKVTPANAYDYIVDLGTMLSEKKVPKTERYVTVNAAYLGLLSKDKRFTANPNVLANGVVEGQKINGMQVMCSEELPANQIVAHHKSAIGSAKQLDEIEAMRLWNHRQSRTAQLISVY